MEFEEKKSVDIEEEKKSLFYLFFFYYIYTIIKSI